MAVAVHNFSSICLDKLVHFHILELSGSFFLWIGDSSLGFEDLQVACPNAYEALPPVTTLMGDLDGPGSTFAQMMSRRFKVPVYLSYNLDASDSSLLMWAQKESIRMLGEVLNKTGTSASPSEASTGAKPKDDGKKKGSQKAPKAKTPEELAADRKAKLKKVIKEGGKRGVEIEGAADMGGLGYFCTSLDEPDGDLELLQESMKAMNAESDPTEEERKGGSGKIGKMLFSAGEQLAIVAYVPAAKTDECDASAWLKHVLDMFGGQFVSGDKGLAVGRILQDSDKNIFPLKLKEPGIMEAINYLKKRDLFPDKDDSDDEFVFGDDDFPE